VAVSLGFGSVHGITLGFRCDVIGEGVDYAIYLFTQTEPSTPPAAKHAGAHLAQTCAWVF
jgi:predicted exporter